MWAWARGKKRALCTDEGVSGSDAGEVIPSTDGHEVVTADGPEVTEEDGASKVDGAEEWVSYSCDPDARWGYKTPKSGDKETYFGYGVFAFTRIPEEGAAKDAIPILTERIVVRPAATDVVEPVLSEIDRILEEGKPVAEIVADRAWSYKIATRWANELRTRGIEHTLDLHPNDQGVQDQDGMRMFAGVAHCPSAPDDKFKITRPKSLKKDTPELAAFMEKVEELQVFALRTVANADADGKGMRVQCPALAGKVRCALRPMTAAFPPSVPAIVAPPKPATAPKCCTQSTVTLPGAAQAKLRQRHVWGSPKWIQAYRRRTHVEGAFGNQKNRNTENLTRGWAQVVGIVKTSILLAASAAATNLRLLRIWAARVRDYTDPITVSDPGVPLFEELAEAVDEPTATGPPPTT